MLVKNKLLYWIYECGKKFYLFSLFVIVRYIWKIICKKKMVVVFYVFLKM